MLHPSSARLIQQLSQDLPQAILLTGPDGIGFAAAIDLLKQGRQLIMLQPEKDDTIDLEKGTITIEMIRSLYDLLRTHYEKERLVVIRDADRMGVPAQNAFLKLLEEPGEGICFVLLSHTPQLLLPTVRSRSQLTELRPLSPTDSQTLLDSLNITDATKRTQLLFIAEGLPARLTTLAQNETLFERRAQIVRDARTFLTGSRYQALHVAEQYKDRREDALVLLTDAAKLLKRQPDAINKIASLLETYERIAQNGNIRLQLATAAI